MARTSDSPATAVARYAVAIYFLALLMALMPPLDVMLSLQQYVWGSPRWRFGAVGLISGSLLLPITGLLLASLTAVVAGHRWLHRVIVFLAGAMVLGLVVLMGAFMLDAVQVRREVNAELLPKYDAVIIKTVLMQLAQIAAVALIGRSALKSGRVLLSEARVERAGAQELVAGTLVR